MFWKYKVSAIFTILFMHPIFEVYMSSFFRCHLMPILKFLLKRHRTLFPTSSWITQLPIQLYSLRLQNKWKRSSNVLRFVAIHFSTPHPQCIIYLNPKRRKKIERGRSHPPPIYLRSPLFLRAGEFAFFWMPSKVMLAHYGIDFLRLHIILISSQPPPFPKGKK